MSHRFGAQFLLRDILVRLGVTAPPRSSEPMPAAVRMAQRAAQVGWRSLPTAVRRSLGVVRVRSRARFHRQPPPAIPADAPRSRCFPLSNGLAAGGIRLNLIGREPCGLLQPGDAVRQFCDQLERDLSDIRDHRTGRPLVARVLRTADHFHGPHLDELPDLLVEWDDKVALSSSVIGRGAGATVCASSPKIGTLEGRNDYGRTGEHRPGGWFVAAGPGIRSGRVETVSVLDFAPTFTRMLGLEIPDCDGSVIPGLDNELHA
jgi:hypothetical protein